MSAIIHDDARIETLLGAEGVAQQGGPLIAEIVFTAIVGGVPLAALEEDDVESGDRQFLGHHTAARARAYYHRGLHARPRTGGYGTPSIFQLTASRLPPCRGLP